DLDSLREQVVQVKERLTRTSQLALQASKDAGEVREVVALYQSDRDAVVQGLKEKGLPLKVRLYEALLNKLAEFAATKGAKATAVAQELTDLGANTTLSSVTNGNRPPEGDVPWVLVLTFSYTELGQKA
ncbi:unnamed protein product, partial [Symbiodinium microadriaticum]